MSRTIKLETIIAAPAETCFDLSRNLDLHLATQTRAREKAIGGKREGLIGYGESVTWQATHFMARLQMTVTITGMDRPFYFKDEMVRGPFLSMSHRHTFHQIGDRTVMRDEFTYQVPFGFLGRWFDRLILNKYLSKVLTERNAFIRLIAESGQQNEFLNTK